MVLQALHGLGLHIARRTALQRDAVVVDVVQQVAVLDEPHAVADAVRAAEMDRLVDAFGAVGLARVERAVDVVGQHPAKGLPELLGREVLLRARQIEAHHTLVLEGDGEIRELVARLRAHVTDAADDDAVADAVLLLSGFQALDDGLDDGMQREPLLLMEDRAVAHLDVADILLGRVLRQLEGRADEALVGLHHGQRHIEGLEVFHQRRAILALLHEGPQLLRRRGREFHLLLLRQLQDRRDPQRAIQVHMEVRLGKTLDIGEGELGHGPILEQVEARA